MEEVVNHNCAGICSQEYCDNPETHFCRMKICEMIFLIGFCEKHADEFDNLAVGGLIKMFQKKEIKNAP
jgi:hypothetical protein